MRLSARMIICVFGALGLLLSGCGGGAPSDFDQRVATWNNAEPENYSFGYSRGGQCGQAVLSITVQAGEVTEVGEATDGCGPRVEDATTIDGLFDLLRTAYDDAHEVTVDYDAEFGFPERVRVDPKENTIDDEWGFGVVDFVAE